MDGYLDEPTTNMREVLANLKEGGGRKWGGSKIKPKAPPVPDYPTWAQLKKGVRVRRKLDGAELRVVSVGSFYVTLSDGKDYKPKELTLI